MVLVGLPGVGKSSAGRGLSRLLRRPFLDFDEEIEKREKRAVRLIFEVDGEDYFRELERGLSLELGARRGMILSPGGGWITRPESVELLRGAGRTIYLRAAPETIFSRLRRIESRPLLAGDDPLGRLRELLVKRASFYEASDAVVDVDGLPREAMVAAVAEVVANLESPKTD